MRRVQQLLAVARYTVHFLWIRAIRRLLVLGGVRVRFIVEPRGELVHKQTYFNYAYLNYGHKVVSKQSPEHAYVWTLVAISYLFSGTSETLNSHHNDGDICLTAVRVALFTVTTGSICNTHYSDPRYRYIASGTPNLLHVAALTEGSTGATCVLDRPLLVRTSSSGILLV